MRGSDVDVDPDPVGSAFIRVRGSRSESRGIKLREKQSLTKRNLIFLFVGNYIFKSEPKKVLISKV